MIVTESITSSEYRMLPVNNPNGTFKTFLPRKEEHEYSVMHEPGAPGKWYIITNWEALNFRLMECAENATADKGHWKEVIAHRDDVLLEDIETFKNHLVVTERREGLTHMVVRRYSDGAEHTMHFNHPAYVCFAGTNPEWDTDKLRYGYTSLTTPQSIYEHDLNTNTDLLLKQQEVIGTFNPQDYTSERIRVKARDGALVPVSIICAKAPLWTVVHPCSCTATEAMGSRSSHVSAARGCPFWTADSSPPLPTFEVVKTSAANGTRTGRWRTR